MQPSKPKLLYLITKSNFGGAQRYVFDLARHFKDSYDVEVIVGGSGTLSKKLQAEGIATTELPSLVRDVSIFRDILVFFSLVRLFLTKKPSIIHLNSSKIGGLGALAGRVCRVPHIVFTAHGWAYNENRPRWQKTLILVSHWYTVLLSHHTITVAENLKKSLSVLPWVSHKMQTIHNGLDQFPLKTRHEARTHLATLAGSTCPQPESDTLWIGTLSELHKNKGLDTLITSFAELKDKKIALFILGEGEERDHLTKLTENLGLTGKVFFLGFVDNAKQYLQAFDIFTLTSRTEAFPYVLLEVGHANIPVLASKVGGIPEIITQFETGILTTIGNTKEVREGLRFLIENPDRRAAMAHKLHTRVQTSFTEQTMFDSIALLYS